MPTNHLILWCPLLLLTSGLPASGSFPVSQFFASGGQSIRASASEQSFEWIFKTDFLYDWLIWSPCSPKDSQESSPTPQFKSTNSSVLRFLYGPTLTSIYDYWKNHSFDSLSLLSHSVMSDSCNPMDCSLPGSSVHGILQARILEWLPFYSPGYLPDLGIEPRSPALQTDSLPTELWEKPSYPSSFD